MEAKDIKIGTKVRLKKGLKTGKTYRGQIFFDFMAFKGPATITGKSSFSQGIGFSIDKNTYFYLPCLFDLVRKAKSE